MGFNNIILTLIRIRLFIKVFISLIIVYREVFNRYILIVGVFILLIDLLII